MGMATDMGTVMTAAARALVGTPEAEAEVATVAAATEAAHPR
jgi:hypothetical protein